MIKKLFLIILVLFICRNVNAQMGGGMPIATNILIYDDGVLQEGSGRTLSFYTKLTATKDTSTGYYIIHTTAIDETEGDILYVNITGDTMTGPLVVGGTQERIFGTNSYIDFDDNSAGTVTFGALATTNLETLFLDLASSPNEATLDSSSGVALLSFASLNLLTKGTATIDTSETVGIGSSMVVADFSNARTISSHSNSSQTNGQNIGLVGEAAADGTYAGYGLMGIGKTSGARIGAGVFGRGYVSNNGDTGNAEGGHFVATVVHNHNNIGVYSQAINANADHNFSFYGVNGVIYNADAVGIGVLVPLAKLDVVGTTRLGDSSTNYAQFATDGDLTFVGTAGLQFAEIYYMDTGFNTALAAQDTYYQILGFAVDGQSNVATPDHTNDHITVGATGIYSVQFNVSARSAAANEYQFMIQKNNGATDLINIMIHRTTSVAGRLDGGASTGFVSLTAGDTVELWVQRLDGGAVSKTITIEHAVLNLMQIGG